MNVSVRIIVAQRHDVVQVPLEAVTRDDEDRPIVAVHRRRREDRRRGASSSVSANNKSVEIVQGLRAGERVAFEATAGGGG